MANPRILLFGTPAAGKSSLLGALAQAAALQPALLKGKLVEESGKLIDLRKSTYHAHPEPTEKLTAYDLRLQPAEGAAPVADATVLDSNGALARDMLRAKEPFVDAQPLQAPVLDADTVVVLVDASLPGKQLEEEFQQFARWLHSFHQARGQRAEVGGLPVYLVLTKCDLLARPNDTFSMWMQRIEEGKRRVDQKFRAYLKKRGTGFGTIDLRLWATSIKRPALADRPAKAQEPYGVAELFRQCLLSAADYMQRRDASQYRLQSIIIGTTGLAAVLAGAIAFVSAYQPERMQGPLTEQVYEVLPKQDARPATRLGGTFKRLEDKQKKLGEIRNDPHFASLPEDSQKAIGQYQDELSRYLKSYQDFQTLLKLPHMAKNELELKEQDTNLKKFKLPEEWQDTPLGKRVAKYELEYKTLYDEADKDIEWCRKQIETNYQLLDKSDAFWKKVRDMKAYDKEELRNWESLKSQFDRQILQKPDPARHQLIPGVTGFKYEELSLLQKVQDKRAEWLKTKEALLERSEFIQRKLK